MLIRDLKAKSNLVSLDLHPAFKQAVPVLKTAWIMYGAECVVTSGKDGKHSCNSAHYDGRAVDLRINNLTNCRWADFAGNLADALVECCGPEWYVVLEKDHLHIEFDEGIPNIKGWKAGIHFYNGVVP